MKLAEEFRQNAEEWRQLDGLAATDMHRRRIAEVANTWLAWAERRERMLRAGHRKPKEQAGRVPRPLPVRQNSSRETD